MAIEKEEWPQRFQDFTIEAGNVPEASLGASPEPPVQESAVAGTTGEPCVAVVARGKAQRRDKGHLHAVRHGALARHPLEALRHLGEDVKALRHLERRFRAELKPRGIIADLIFDRFWAAYLRCLLAARVEASAFLVTDTDRNPGRATTRIPALIQADRPMLVINDEQESTAAGQTLSPDVLHQLLLVQRYDRHFSREMFSALGLLLIMRTNGESGLEQSLASMVGISKERSTSQ